MIQENTGCVNKMCRQCATHLTCDYAERPKSIDNCWTGFIWSILRSEDMQAKYEEDSIWKFNPSKWRYWWIVEIKIISLTLLDIYPWSLHH